jgi:hypothetical protein
MSVPAPRGKQGRTGKSGLEFLLEGLTGLEGEPPDGECAIPVSVVRFK